MNTQEKYNKKFDGIDFYKKYPEYSPFIGDKYDEDTKILLIAESHYLAHQRTDTLPLSLVVM